ncbi:cytokine receptor common subunit beta isoform X2 [Anabas testudineus]|uniref:cytokine receptor common subunit beta isoform X2 n=1 Tax=Anabas testudineus TaxID=64144 RepID=UPI000E45E089|nr:cytokine receptor common subunit beta isoform X2 [Anabas testudineus]
MTHLLWLVLWSVHHCLALSLDPDNCSFHESSSAHNVSPLLESLECYNDYQSYIYCQWKENTTLQLWLKTKNGRELCELYGTVQCKIKPLSLAIGIKHTFFFLNNETPAVCSSAAHGAVHLSQHLRARPPVDLSTHDAADGGRWISWSSPYPSSSSLNKNLTYQLSYRTDTQDNWKTVDVTNTRLKLEKQSLLPGQRYEAKARTRASVGKWSDWTPVVTWKSEDDTGQPPRLHCVLDGETEVTCSWEVSRDLARFIYYQLNCQHNQTPLLEGCCVNPTVTSDLRGTVLTYSCSVNVTDPAHLKLELQPKHISKTFDAFQHIKPKQPEQVEVKKKDGNWVVEWTQPHMNLNLNYQVCYYMTQDEGSSTYVNRTTLDLIIPGESLVPSQQYQVKVRSLVDPGYGSTYEGIPSEWTEPKNWTSHSTALTEAWSVTNFLYFLISVFVAVVFLIFYCSFPSCQRRIILWVDSVPSPGKSKILSELKSATSGTFMQNDDDTICNVLHFDTVSTCSSDVSLWPIKDTDKNSLEPDEGFWNEENLLPLAEKANHSDTSSMSFSGPYIFCQKSHPIHMSADSKSEGEVKEDKSSPDDSPSPVNFALFGEGYVCLPSRTMSRSTQDLVSHSEANKNTHMYDSPEQNPQCPDTSMWTGEMDVQPGISELTGRTQPPAYTSRPFSPWPQGGQTQASGYCFLPQPK